MNFETSPSTEKLDSALAKAQGEILTASKDKVNPHFRSKYADIAGVWDACREALSKHGVSVTQWPVHSEDGRLHLITRMAHAGEWIKSEFSIPVGKNDAHGYGSATTYIKRFALAAAVGVVSDDPESLDDDGNAASNRGQQQQEKNSLKITAKEMDAELGPKAAPAVKPKTASKAVVKPLDQNAEPKIIPTRDEMNKRIMELYRPYLTKFPQTKFDELLTARYNVGETRMMTTEQMLNLAEMMEQNLGMVKEAVQA